MSHRTRPYPGAVRVALRRTPQHRDAQAAVRMRVAAPGTQLLLPLGLWVLPAFVALGVAPLLVTMIGSTLAVL